MAGAPGSVTVTADDLYGNVATGYRGTVKFSSSDTNAALPANYTFTAANAGTHTFTNGVTLKTVGTQSITATDTVTGTITGTRGRHHGDQGVPDHRHHPVGGDDRYRAAPPTTPRPSPGW